MQRTQVSSTNLKSVGYDPTTQTLEIQFKAGSIYQYFKVPESKYTSLMSATSKGSFFSSHIKNVYQTRKI